MEWQAGIWAVTLWTAGRVPTLVTFGPRHMAASQLGRLALDQWKRINLLFPNIAVDEHALLPDRFRALVHAPSLTELELGLAWYRSVTAAEARQARLTRSSVIWEFGHDRMAVETAEELVTWRRRLRTGRAMGLSGGIPESASATADR